MVINELLMVMNQAQLRKPGFLGGLVTSPVVVRFVKPVTVRSGAREHWFHLRQSFWAICTARALTGRGVSGGEENVWGRCLSYNLMSIL